MINAAMFYSEREPRTPRQSGAGMCDTCKDSHNQKMLENNGTKEERPCCEMEHASSIKEMDEEKYAKVLMVIKIGFLIGCQLAV